jgi:hypothetical protein
VKPCQCLESSVQWYHIHHCLSAPLPPPPKRLRSWIPRPHNSFGLHAISHLTRHAPPLLPSPSSPFRKKFLLSLLIFFRIFFRSHFGSLKAVAWYVTVEVKTDFMSCALAAFVINFPFQLGSFPPTLSSNGMNSTFLSFLGCNSKPRYRQGKAFTEAGKPSRTSAKLMLLQLIGQTLDLRRLVRSLEA